MNKVDLLEQLKAFTMNATGDLLLPVRQQEKDITEPLPRAADVFLMRLPDFQSATKKAPYILHQVITGADVQDEGEDAPDASAVIRSIFCVYCKDEQEGGLHLLNLMERLRIALLETPIIGKRYELNLQSGIESMIYPDGVAGTDRTAPYYLGEMLSTWELPKIQRKDCDPWQKMKQFPMTK